MLHTFFLIGIRVEQNAGDDRVIIWYLHAIMYHERGVTSAREGVDISTLLDQRANARLPVVGGRHMGYGGRYFTGPALLEMGSTLMGTRLEKLEHARHVTFPRHMRA